MHNPNLTPLIKLLTDRKMKVIRKGEVFSNTDDARTFSLVFKGYVKRYTIKNDGSSAIQSIYGPGDCFPLTIVYKELLDQVIYSGPETIHYEAITDVMLYSIDIQSLKEEVAKDPEIYKSLLYVSGQRTQSNIQRLENISLLLFYNRVAHQLLYLAETFGKDISGGKMIDVPLTQVDIGDILSSTRETVSIAIRDLKKKNIIKSVPGRKLVVIDMERLKEEAYS